MHILIVLRNLYNNPDPFEDELVICDSDVNAITEACEIREQCGGKVSALLFSESKSDYEKVLIKAASYGADDVYHACVDDFDFSDANSFSRLIAKTIDNYFFTESNSEGAALDNSKDNCPSTPDIIMFGRLAYDGDSVNIATQVAENMDWHRSIYSSEVVFGEDAGPSEATNLDSTSKLKYKKAMDDGATVTALVPLPAVLHTVRRTGLRRQAKVSDIMRAYSEVSVKSIDANIMADAIKAALDGPSLPTPVQEIPPYSGSKDMTVLNGISDVDTAANIISTLRDLGFQPR